MATRPLRDMTEEEVRAALSGPPDQVAAHLCAAAGDGVVQAQLLYGQALLDGIGVAADQVAALHWFGEAARAGDAMGMNMVGRCCEHGWGTRIDLSLAEQWYAAAAERGLDWGMYNLATLICIDPAQGNRRAEALALFRRAAALGHAKSANMVGSFHEDGWVVARDLAAARNQYRRAADGGDFRGRFNLARLLADEGRIDEALAWFARVPETATPRFIAQMRTWLAAHPDDRLRAAAAQARLCESAIAIAFR